MELTAAIQALESLKRKNVDITIFTDSKYVIDGITKSKTLELQLIGTGLHLSTEFGLTIKAIEESGLGLRVKILVKTHNDFISKLSTSGGGKRKPKKARKN